MQPLIQQWRLTDETLVRLHAHRLGSELPDPLSQLRVVLLYEYTIVRVEDGSRKHAPRGRIRRPQPAGIRERLPKVEHARVGIEGCPKVRRAASVVRDNDEHLCAERIRCRCGGFLVCRLGLLGLLGRRLGRIANIPRVNDGRRWRWRWRSRRCWRWRWRWRRRRAPRRWWRRGRRRWLAQQRRWLAQQRRWRRRRRPRCNWLRLCCMLLSPRSPAAVLLRANGRREVAKAARRVADVISWAAARTTRAAEAWASATPMAAVVPAFAVAVQDRTEGLSWGEFWLRYQCDC